ncbi:unnamed protein product [Moneuplotes crassus]|uniref:Calpain catalytic domain-containing protein n=1 Tax=Euplotes crassus TaxID=5936 RepID=A0AAD1Y186_EUPCR|nr:unnamed protein product [Moneuplotes crassus]
MNKAKHKKRANKPIPGLTKPEDQISLKEIDKRFKHKRDKATKVKDDLNEKIEKLSQLTEESKLKRARMNANIAKKKGTAREIKRSKNFTIDVENIEFPDTVIQTSDEVTVMEAVQNLIKEHVDYDDDEMFTDPDFKAIPDSIYLQDDISKEEKKDFWIDDNLQKVKWFRIKEIAEDDEWGFSSLSYKKIDDMRICQGQLKDNWFLSALSILRTEDSLFQNLTCDKQFDRYRNYGLYVFKFYKNGSSCYVIIDDKIPCLEKSNGSRVPYFARSRYQNLFWVSLIEKAYAKLHKRYWALNNGTIEDALHDLAGIYPEWLPIDQNSFTDSGKLYDALKIFTLSGSLIGTSLIYDKTEISKALRTKEETAALSKGIQPGVYYSVLDCRECTIDEESGKSAKIVRIQNSWEDSPEWNGEFSDEDEIWTPKLKKYFKSLSSNQDNPRYVHQWYSDDGIFCMRIEDFAQYFNSIYIMRDFPDNFEGVKYTSKWDPSFGYQNKKNVDWIKNPQYVFKVNDQKPVDFTIFLQQKDPRFISSNSPPYIPKLLNIGFLVCKIASTENELKFYHESKEIYRKSPTCKRFVHGKLSLPIGRYILVPFTENTGDCSEFQLKFFFDSDFINFITPGYKVILENEQSIEPIKQDISKKDILSKMNERLHKGGKYDNVLGEVSSMRVRTHKNTPGDWLIKHEIATNSWASKIMVPFNCDYLINTKGMNETIVKAGLHDKNSRISANASLKQSKSSNTKDSSVPKKVMVDHLDMKKEFEESLVIS